MKLDLICFLLLLENLIHCINGIVEFKESPQSETWPIGRPDSRLRCTLTHENKNTGISWYKDNLLIHPKPDHLLIQNHETSSNNNVSMLSFVSLLKSDAGNYECKVKLLSGDIISSNEGVITITGPPTIVIEPVNTQTTLHNSSFLIYCNGKGSPSISKIKWMYIMFSNEKQVYYNVINANSTLRKIPDVDVAVRKNVTSYDIWCNVTNSLGETQSEKAVLDLNRKPNQPSITDITQNSKNVTVFWDAKFKDLNRCFVKFTSKKESHFFEIPTPTKYFMLNNLTENTNYTCQVKCANSLFYSKWSTPKSISTYSNNCSLSLNVTVIGSKVRLSWPNTPKSSGYVVEIKSLSLPFKTFYYNTTNSSVILSNLGYGKTYRARVQAIGKIDCSTLDTFQDFVIPHILYPNITRIKLKVAPKKSEVYFTLPTITMLCELHFIDVEEDFNINLKNDLNSVRQLLKINTNYSLYIKCKDKNNKNFSSPVTLIKSLPKKPERVNLTIDIDILNNSTVNVTCYYSQVMNEDQVYFNICISLDIDISLPYFQCYKSSNMSIVINPPYQGYVYSSFVSACNRAGCSGVAHKPFKLPGVRTKPHTTTRKSVLASSTEATPHVHITIIVVIAVVFCAFVGFIFFCLRRRRKRHSDVPQTNGRQRWQVDGGNLVNDDRNGNDYIVMSPEGSFSLLGIFEEQLREVLISKSDLDLGKVIGEGEFGLVYQGTLKLEEGGSEKVAVKSIKMDERTMEEKEEFVREGLRMKDLDHPNVMPLIGICFTDLNNTNRKMSPLVVLPFMEHGDMKSYLFTSRSSGFSSRFTVLALLKLALDVAKGMQYLAARNFVHRDLAARNCMLDGEYKVVVCDFGLSRKLYSSNYYRQHTISKLPVKWMAMESLGDNIFTSMTDVWAFGVTMWEIFSLAQVPYPGVANQDLYQLLRNGLRLSRPKTCPKDVWYNVVDPCWHAQVADRITFDALVETLSNFIEHPEEDFLKPVEISSVNISSEAGYDEVVEVAKKEDYSMAKGGVDRGYSIPATTTTPLLEQDQKSDSSSVLDL